MHHTHSHMDSSARPYLHLIRRAPSQDDDDLPPSDLPPLVNLGILREPESGRPMWHVRRVGVSICLALAALSEIGLALAWPEASQTLLLAGILLMDTASLVRLVLRG